MFSGIISDIGQIVAIDKLSASADELITDWRVTIESSLAASKCKLGASIACNGICLTVAELVEQDGVLRFIVQAARTTRERTTVADWRAGGRINLEGSLSLGDSLDGHLVMGHVDGRVRLAGREQRENELSLAFELDTEARQADEDWANMLVARGSVAIDGVSLTVASCKRASHKVSSFTVCIVPYTAKHTTLGELRLGDWANIELDLLARYVAARTSV